MKLCLDICFLYDILIQYKVLKYSPDVLCEGDTVFIMGSQNRVNIYECYFSVVVFRQEWKWEEREYKSCFCLIIFFDSK